jgi:chitin synthase
MAYYNNADEAQRHHYNDGYNPYANPFEHQAQQQPAYGSPPVHPLSPPPPSSTPMSYNAYDPYAQHQYTDAQHYPQQQAPPPHHQQAPYPPPPPPAQSPFHHHDDAYLNPTPPPPSTSPGYALRDDGPLAHDDDQDAGDIPLLRRQTPNPIHIDPNTDYSTIGMPMPGDYNFGAGQEQEDEETNIRYGRIPQRVPRRYKTIKKVELFHGNLVIDSPVPSKLLDLCAIKTEREFTHMRYSAATCDPNEFKDSGFTLRQIHYDPPRRTELFIVMTMYNEDEELFCRTMTGVVKNIAHLCKRDRSKTWGKDGWKKVVVCIVSDGRSKINSRTLSVIAAMGAYQEGVGKVCRRLSFKSFRINSQYHFAELC